MFARAFSGMAVTGAGVALVWHMVQPMLLMAAALMAQLHGLLAVPLMPQP